MGRGKWVEESGLCHQFDLVELIALVEMKEVGFI